MKITIQTERTEKEIMAVANNQNIFTVESIGTRLGSRVTLNITENEINQTDLMDFADIMEALDSCNNCSKNITEEVFNFNLKNGVKLCMDCSPIN